MRIGVDMAATAGQKSGLGFYVENVVRNMQDILKEERVDSSNSDEIVEFHTIQKNLRTPQRILWDQYGVRAQAAMKKVDTLFVPAFSTPRTKKSVVMTAHDIYGILYPEQFAGRISSYYWTKLLPQSMKRAEHLICISEYTKQSIASNLDITEKNMTVVPLAASSAHRIIQNQQWLADRLKECGITGAFLLSVGTLEPRKNFARLIEAFAFANRSIVREDGTEEPIQLVIVGKKGWETDEIFNTMKKYNLEKTVVWLDYVTEDQKIALYNTCAAAIFPSIFEGFGLPPLEAMQCGAPVAVANNTSMPEVVGDAGLLFNPFEIEDIRARINYLLENPATRKDLRSKSIQHTKQFSWRTTSEKTLDIIRKMG